MPTFEANDGVSLNYEAHGSASNKPLVLVNLSCPPLRHMISSHVTI